MKMDPFPPDREPTSRDTILRLEQLHQCVEQGHAKIAVLDGKVDGVSNQVARVEGLVEGLAKGFGIHHDQPAKSPKVRIKWDLKTTLAVVGSLGGVLLLFRVLNEVVPVAWHALLGVPLQ